MVPCRSEMWKRDLVIRIAAEGEICRGKLDSWVWKELPPYIKGLLG